MLKRLERDAAKADLAAVEALLNARTRENDPVGFMQFSRRVEDLTRRLREIEEAPSTSAEVGLFFGGLPVVGSHGIKAEFGASAIAAFQTLVSSAFAATEGALGARGPVPQRDRSQLMLTDVARGSFGFILQDSDDQQLFDSTLKEAISRSVDLVVRVASPDQETFESIAEDVDSRVFASLRSFFKVLDDAGATMRIVEDRREFALHREEVGFARERTEQVTLAEEEGEFVGALYVLPVSRRFELHPTGGGEALNGRIAPDCLARLTAGGTEVLPGIVGTVRTVRLRVREIRTRGAEPRKSYTLLSLTDAGQLPTATQETRAPNN
jgi:hypothetical protein